MALGLCSSCYQHYQRYRSREEKTQRFILLDQIVQQHATVKSNLIDERASDRRRRANKRRRISQGGRWIRLQSRYGLSREDYEQMLSLQNEVCYLCEVKHEKDILYVDHNHKTGQVRKLLCPSCNTFVGYLETKPELIDKMKEYINDRHI